MRRVEQNKRIDLDRIVFIGRTFEEYLEIFSLSAVDLLSKKVLDCASGACSFTTGANHLGMDVTACDITYDHEVIDLKLKGIKDIKHAMEHVESDKENYVWEYFKDVEELGIHRLKALNECTDDMLAFPNHYVPVMLPVLPFKDEAFDIVLSAHLLFMYADRLDYEFHISSLNELLRVAKEEIRIFPTVDLEGNRYKHLDKIIMHLQDMSCAVEEVKVSYEFQRNANSFLKINKGM